MRHINIKDTFPNIRDNNDIQWIKLKLKWYSLIHRKGGRCSKCGESNFSVLEFHHTDPDKKDDQISYLIMGL